MAGDGASTPNQFLTIESCSLEKDRSDQTVVSSLNGTLLRSLNPFPYYMLIALEAGSPLRALVLLLLSPFIWCTCHVLMNQALALQLLIFVSTAGLRLSDIAGVSKAVLPRFFLDDLHPRCYKVLRSCGKRYVLTSFPTVMVEYTMKEHVGIEEVFGSELQVTNRGYCTGFVSSPHGLKMGSCKAETVKKVFTEQAPSLGLGSKAAVDFPFLSLCKEAYTVEQAVEDIDCPAVKREEYWKPLIFHDGRLVVHPTPLWMLTLLLWTPIGLVLATFRIMITLCLPMEIGYPSAALLGVKYRVRGAPPLPLPKGQKQGLLFVCTHRTLLDPTLMCVALRRKVRALTYSVSWVSELISPIKTAHLTRDRAQDAHLIGEFLGKEEDLFVCPEGTTCREPYLLRFSSLFAELTEHIAPVATRVETSLFWGNSARGYKALDSIFFLMNPRPSYEIIFLDRLSKEETVASGKSSVEVAKAVQKKLAETLGYVCTELTRKDKYTILAGNDGTVKDKRFTPKTAAQRNDCGSGKGGGTDDDKSF